MYVLRLCYRSAFVGASMLVDGCAGCSCAIGLRLLGSPAVISIYSVIVGWCRSGTAAGRTRRDAAEQPPMAEPLRLVVIWLCRVQPDGCCQWPLFLTHLRPLILTHPFSLSRAFLLQPIAVSSQPAQELVTGLRRSRCVQSLGANCTLGSRAWPGSDLLLIRAAGGAPALRVVFTVCRHRLDAVVNMVM